MVQIEEEKILEVENLISFRGKIKVEELQKLGQEMENKASLAGAKKVAYPITATYSVEGDLIDIEMLLPIDKPIDDIDKFRYKSKVKIVNAIVAKHRGNPMKLQSTCNKLNQYLIEHKLVPITVGYNVTKKIDALNVEDTEIDVYVGISPNIL